METPEKRDSSFSSLTPVRTPSTPTTSATTIVSNRLAQIVKKLSDNCKEWESQQQHGTDIIKAIIVNIPKDSSAQNADHYTASLERLCKQLHACVAIFHDVNETTKKCLEELRALWALSGQSKDVQSKSWNFEQYIKWTEETVEEFQEIYEIKKIVMEEIAHAFEKSDLELHRSIWEFTDPYLSLRFKFLEVERT
ncbi:unnamed protein product [Hermetia illucens]|uniref:Uncharacterized protein n=1 Tax=Hermetia illucens TaxID=343691 RepID=A0A7R8UUE3_HERIL|nr:uncharacterized protein LOC119651984 [Hermetia illucens]CAD7086153.1 unnamed protein product [Hermetia illucens]